MANLSDIKNTPSDMILPSSALGRSHKAEEFVEAGHRVNSDNGAVNGGKMLGRVQVVKDAGGSNVPRLYIATGRDPEANWSVTDITIASIVPAYTLIPAPVVGVGSDLKPDYRNTNNEDAQGIASVPFPVVLQRAYC